MDTFGIFIIRGGGFDLTVISGGSPTPHMGIVLIFFSIKNVILPICFVMWVGVSGNSMETVGKNILWGRVGCEINIKRN